MKIDIEGFPSDYIFTRHYYVYKLRRDKIYIVISRSKTICQKDYWMVS